MIPVEEAGLIAKTYFVAGRRHRDDDASPISLVNDVSGRLRFLCVWSKLRVQRK